MVRSFKIQIIDSKDADHRLLLDLLKGSGYQVVLSPTVKRALKDVRKERPDLIFVALDLPDLHGVEILKKIKKVGGDSTLFSLVSSLEKGVEAMKLDSEYYFITPYNIEEVKIVLERYLALKCYRERVEELRLRYLDTLLEQSEAVEVSRSMKEIYQTVLRLAENGDAPLLITGEVGTGKKLLARIIHLRSHHFMFPFVAVNYKDKGTPSLDAQLVGLDKDTDDFGRVSEQHIVEGGTLFLYNIEHLTRADQLKVLTFLKSRKLVKGQKGRGAIMRRRIIAATSADLKVLVDKGKFNKELYQRIDKRSVHIPPLRKRPKEIIPLAIHFVESFSKEYGKKVTRIDPEVKNHLESYEWPGNVTELKNVIEHAVILSQSENISMNEIETKFNKNRTSLDTLLMNGSFLSLDEMVSLYVNTVIKKVKGNKSKAAKILRVSRNTLKKKTVAL